MKECRCGDLAQYANGNEHLCWKCLNAELDAVDERKRRIAERYDEKVQLSPAGRRITGESVGVAMKIR